jgi:bifunctional non-homologous end joining protein LigD
VLFLDNTVMARPRRGESGGRSPQLLNGAKRASFPSYIEPCSPRTGEAPARGEWLCEIKHDGYRTQAHMNRGHLALYSRRGHDWSDRFLPVAQALRLVTVESAVLDGEIVVLGSGGIADFRMLQADLAAKRTDRLAYFVFDLLYLDGFDLRGCAIEERKKLLRELFPSDNKLLRFSEHFEIAPGEMFGQACRLGFEGIVCKQLGSRYHSGESDDWVKVKCKKSETFPIIAFVEKLGASPRRIASLYLGRWVDGQLLYAGKAETGFKQEMLYELRERLDPYIRKTAPLSVPVKKPKATWVEPVVEAEIEYNNLTAGNILRMPVFKGVRDDLRKEASSNARRRSNARPAVPRANILQWLPDATAPSKEELSVYWRRVEKQALEYLARRPLKLVRRVHGTIFYHMGPLPPIPSSVHELKIRKREGGEGTRLWIDDLAGFLGLLEIGAIELHPWNSTVDDIEHPDTLVFDLDPGDGISWGFVIESALAMREILSKSGHDCWPKLTGGKGIHIMVPIDSKMTHDAAHSYAKRLAQELAATARSRYTLSATMSERKGRLFIDYLRNGRGTTAVGTYSPRAREGFPIAAPVTWSDVESGLAADAFTIFRLPRTTGRGRTSSISAGSRASKGQVRGRTGTK